MIRKNVISQPMMHVSLLPLIAVVLTAALCWPTESTAGKRNLIRFYKSINEQGQERVLMMVKNDDEPGCHTVNSRRKASRIAVMGFEYCEIFAEPECAVDSKVQPLWAKKADRLIDRASDGRMTQGTRWLLNRGDNLPFRSFRCAMSK